MIYNNHQ